MEDTESEGASACAPGSTLRTGLQRAFLHPVMVAIYIGVAMSLAGSDIFVDKGR